SSSPVQVQDACRTVGPRNQSIAGNLLQELQLSCRLGAPGSAAGGLMRVLLAVLILFAVPAWAQTPDGATVFQQSCATCHTGAVESRAPAPEALRSRSPQAVVESLVNGAMRAQGARLSGAERRAVAEYLTRKTIAGDVRGADTGRCGVADQLPAARARLPRWAGWSPAATN